MALRDYSEDDDYYVQGFEHKGVASVWVGVADRALEIGTDTLQDLCGVGYYRLSDQESDMRGNALVEVSELLSGISYAATFSAAVLEAAESKQVAKARRIVVQFDFAYVPERVVRFVSEDPVFLGVFPYGTDEQPF